MNLNNEAKFVDCNVIFRGIAYNWIDGGFVSFIFS